MFVIKNCLRIKYLVLLSEIIGNYIYKCKSFVFMVNS